MTALSVDDGELDLGALEFENMEHVTFGVDSGAAVTVVSPDVASDYPRSQAGGKKKMTDCQGTTWCRTLARRTWRSTVAKGTPPSSRE